MSALESRRPPEPVEDLTRRTGTVEKRKRNEQLTPAERVKNSLTYSLVLGKSLESILEGERPKAEVEKMSEISMVLRRGEELRRVGISETNTGRNTIDVRHYALEDAPKNDYVVAFVKSEAGQRVFDYNEQAKEVTAKQASYRQGQGAEYVMTMETVEPDLGETAGVPDSWMNVPAVLEAMANHYQVDLEYLPQPNPHEFTHRLFIMPDHPVRAERVAYLHAEFFGLKGVLPTELRASEGMKDVNGNQVIELNSVQQMAPSLDEDTPMEPMSAALKDALEGSTPAHPLHESLLCLAALHSITFQTDGHPSNVLAPRGFTGAKETAGKPELYGIDFGLAYPPVSRVEKIKDASGRLWDIDCSPHAHLSYPQYIVESNPDWKMKQETRATLQSRVDACRAWMEVYDRDPNSVELDQGSKEVEFLLNTFLFLRGHHLEKNKQKRDAIVKIAKRDMRGQLNMVDYIATNGRPPELKSYGLSQNIIYDSQKARKKAAKVLEDDRTGVGKVKREKIGAQKQKPEVQPRIDVTDETVLDTGSNPFSRR